METQKPVKGKLEPLLGKTLVSVRVYRTSSHSNRHVYALRFRHTHETPKCQTPPSTADMQMPRMSDARHQGQLSSKYPGCQRTSPRTTVEQIPRMSTHVTKDSCREIPRMLPAVTTMLIGVFSPSQSASKKHNQVKKSPQTFAHLVNFSNTVFDNHTIILTVE